MDQENPPLKLPENSKSVPRLSDHEVDERAAEAQALLDNELFTKAVDGVYSRAVGTLLNAEVGSLTASSAHATMKALIDIRNQLEQYVADQKMRKKFGK
jgi:hypothetical protein